MRAKARFNVNLKATYCIRVQGSQHQECLITNLSASGATVRFPRTESEDRDCYCSGYCHTAHSHAYSC